MFICGTNGFVRFYPDSIKDNTYIPAIVITAFKRFDKPVPLDTAISEKKVLELFAGAIQPEAGGFGLSRSGMPQAS
jgi:hypothetical protein